MFTRKSTGIPGVDRMIQGGIPHGSVVGLHGPAGVGKSIFALHFLLEGASIGERCAYINLDEPRENIDRMISEFSFSKKLFDFVKKDQILIHCFNYHDYEKVYKDVMGKIKYGNSLDRVVIDSFNVFYSFAVTPECMSLPDDAFLRRMINDALFSLRNKKLTSIITLEKQDSEVDKASSFVPYLVDGVINLDFLELGIIERRIFIPKMRWTDQFKESRPFSITKDGIKIEKER